MNVGTGLKILIIAVSTFMAIEATNVSLGAEEIDLAGRWLFQLDPDNVGVAQNWYTRELPDSITLPGSVQIRGYGEPPGPDTVWIGDIRETEGDKEKYAPYRTKDNFKMPFWLQPDRYYSGPAWFRKTIRIPGDWQGKHVILFLERPHWKTTVWINGKELGSQLYLSAAHQYDVSNAIRTGENDIVIRVENGMVINVGPNSHSVSDHTQSNWNGIVGEIKLVAQPVVWIEDVQVFGDARGKNIRGEIKIGNRTGMAGKGTLTATLLDSGLSPKRFNAKWTTEGGTVSFTYALGKRVRLWDEFSPQLYRLEVELDAGAGLRDRRSVSFGLRDVATAGTQITVNGRPIFLRGTLECCIFPKTGYPPMDVAAWKRNIRVCQTHGLNHMRFHSWCPPEAAFDAADELGFYLQVECSTWPNQGAVLGRGDPIDEWAYREADRILTAYGNHPSFLLFALGNEPANKQLSNPYLAKWVEHCRSKDRRHLITAASGHPILLENDFHVTPSPRIQHWGEGLKSRINARPPETTTDYSDFIAQYPTQPVVSHEIGQWCVYPDFDEIRKYTGILKPKNFEIFRDLLDRQHMGDQAHEFLMASGKLQTLCYKEEIESALRTRGFGGFHLLSLQDFPGQGTALVGILDPFWDSKPYVGPEEFSRFCGSTVPLARMSKRVFTRNETLKAQIDVAHYGPEDID
ncbi:MAG: glycoside hydrolase, partial [Candidatus Hydrogenedentes bacterium]|nr:glycoside hydrolase [Candidatus Hydrogenedentota bacterium]